MSSQYDIGLLKTQKKEILERKKLIPKENIEEIKDIAKEYFRIQKKIQYYSDENHRLNKNILDSERHKANKDTYNEYQKKYYALKKLNTTL